MTFPRGAVISGVGQSAVGRRLHVDGLELAIDACLSAVADAGLDCDQVDGLASFPGDWFPTPGFNGANSEQIRTALGLRCNWFLGAVETAGQLGPVMEAALAVNCGLADHVVVFRALTESSGQQGAGRGSVFDVDKGGQLLGPVWQWAFGGFSPANWVALLAQRYMYEHGLTKEQLGQIPINARRNAAVNPEALYRTPMSMHDYLSARPISTPFGLFDCDAPCDGAVAVVVSSRRRLTDLRRSPITIESVGTGMSERITWDQRPDLTSMGAHEAAAHMWSQTDLKPKDVDTAQLYDGFSYLALQWLEALGFAERGKAGDFVDGGDRIARDGELPLNTGGGQLSAGRLHGFGHLREACLQLWNEGGERQITPQPEVAAVSAGGGPIAGCMLLSHGR